MSLKIRNDGTSITGIVISAAEKHYNAKFVMDTSVDLGNGWIGPVALFYGEWEHPVSKSRYFALRVADSKAKPGEQTVYIMNGQSAVDHTYDGLVLDDEVYISRYRHDFRAVGPDYIDGGLDYTRLVGLSLPIVKFNIVDGEPVFQQELDQRDMTNRFPNIDKVEPDFMDKVFDEFDPENPEKFWK